MTVQPSEIQRMKAERIQEEIAGLAKDLAHPDRIADVCAHLLPDGARLCNTWIEKSISVQLPYREQPWAPVIPRAGQWQNYADPSEGGNLYDLWVKVRGTTHNQTSTEIKAYLRHLDRDFLYVDLGSSHDGKPLALVRNLPGQLAELSPSRMRQLAAALMRAAEECEKEHGFAVPYRPPRRKYSLDGESH